MSHKYTCAMCGEENESERSREEAWAEHDKNFPGEPHESAASVCDDCYQQMVALKPPPGMAQ